MEFFHGLIQCLVENGDLCCINSTVILLGGIYPIEELRNKIVRSFFLSLKLVLCLQAVGLFEINLEPNTFVVLRHFVICQTQKNTLSDREFLLLSHPKVLIVLP